MNNLILMFVGAVLIIAAFYMFIRFFPSFSKSEKNELRTQKNEHGGTEFVRCPLCSTPLAKSENMISKIYRPMNTPDQRMTVSGCPHCYPVVKAGLQRKCPVCGKTVPTEGYLIARLFNRTTGKKHVMITGCTECYKKS